MSGKPRNATFIEDTYELIGIAEDIDVAKGMLLRLMLVEKHGVIVTRDARVTNSQWDKFNKWARSVFYCTRIDGGFLVHQSRTQREKLH
jgi:hypothetical protein